MPRARARWSPGSDRDRHCDLVTGVLSLAAEHDSLHRQSTRGTWPDPGMRFVEPVLALLLLAFERFTDIPPKTRFVALFAPD